MNDELELCVHWYNRLILPWNLFPFLTESTRLYCNEYSLETQLQLHIHTYMRQFLIFSRIYCTTVALCEYVLLEILIFLDFHKWYCEVKSTFVIYNISNPYYHPKITEDICEFHTMALFTLPVPGFYIISCKSLENGHPWSK